MIGMKKRPKKKLEIILFASQRTLEERKHIISNEFDIEMDSDMAQEVDEMCNLSDGVYEAGKADQIVAMVERKMKLKNMTCEEAMDDLDCTPEERQAYYNYVNN